MTNKIKWGLLVLVLAMTSCLSPRQITYIRDFEYDTDYPAKPAPELRVRPEDQLSIQVFSSDPALAVPFNTGANTTEGLGVTKAATYIVDGAGYIDFPVLGRLHLEGMTLKEVQRSISNRIISSGYIREPVVSVNLENFTYTLIKYGSTTRMNVAGRSINLLQAVAPMQGEKIKDVMVIRTENGQRRAYSVNFLTKDIFDSPVFYLQQNDIVYVKPTRWMMSQTFSTLWGTVSTTIGIFTSIYNILVLTKVANGNK